MYKKVYFGGGFGPFVVVNLRKNVVVIFRENWLNDLGPEIVAYMDTHKKEKLKQKMRAEIRSLCGLGSPPARYTTNANECMNSKIKKMKGVGKLTLRETLELLAQAYNEQFEQVSLALVNKGQYSIIPSLKSQFTLTTERYYNASRDERTAEIQRFQQYIPPKPFVEGEILVHTYFLRVYNHF